ncbi:hypothetical protein ACX80N_12340 [Arthrobacter sp. MDT2-16]
MVDITAEYLAQALEDAAASFAPGELAYLALTSKVEQPLRDRLAWSLFTKLPDLVVTREWKYTDLAILDLHGAPLALIEAKALYTFDVVTPDRADVRKYKREVESDIAKAFTLLKGRPASVFALVLVAHPMGLPSAGFEDALKYQSKIKAALKNLPEQEVRVGAKKSLSSALAPVGRAVHGSLAGGTAIGVQVDVDYMVIEPVAPPA